MSMEKTISIRPIHADEALQLAEIKRRCTIANADHVGELMAIPGALQVSPEHIQHVLAAESAEGLIGFATVLPPVNGIAEVEDLFVDPEFWRQGVATLLMKVAEEQALTNGARSLHVVSGKQARQFYESLGFQFKGMTMTQFSAAPTLEKLLENGAEI